MCELAQVFKHMICLFLTTSYVLLRIRQTINTVEEEVPIEALLDGIDEKKWSGAVPTAFNHDYFIDFMLPVTTLCLTLLSIMVGLQQVINMCLDMDDEEHPQQQ